MSPETSGSWGSCMNSNYEPCQHQINTGFAELVYNMSYCNRRPFLICAGGLPTCEVSFMCVWARTRFIWITMCIYQ